MLDAIDAFILHLATERGLSVNYQILVRRVLEMLAGWLQANRQKTEVAAVTTQDLSDYLAERKRGGLAAASLRPELVSLPCELLT